MNTDALIALAVPLSMFGLPPLVKWWWKHPRVNMEKLKRRLDESNEVKERLAMCDELLQDLDLQEMKRLNKRVKGVTITWADNLSGAEKTLHILLDGKDKSTEQLRNLAKVVRQESTKELMKLVYKLPKRHGRNEPPSVITIHGID